MSLAGKCWILNAVLFVSFSAVAGIALAQQSQTQDQHPPPKKKDEAPAPSNRLTVEVTGGDANTPVENASVYVKTVEQHLLKDKKFEVNVKTNQK